MLVLKDFSKSYGDTLIIAIDRLVLPPGIHWIRGQNGSGKSTLFKSLAGIIPCKGEVAFEDGVTLHNHPVDYRRRVNYSEAEPLFPGFLTAKDLVKFIGKAKGASTEQMAYWVDLFQVKPFYEHPCETYSSGMLKKLSLVLAFLGSPQVIILDEPLITLDAQTRETLLHAVKLWIEKTNGIILMSSHQVLDDVGLKINLSFSILDKTLVPGE
jgi:ABC-2 type transport system ATP-binding protein